MTDGLSLEGTTTRVSQMLRQKEEKRANERRRQILYLTVAFLENEGFLNSAITLHKEAQLSTDVQACDNIDLETILQEYTDYYYAKFNKYPKFCKKIELGAGNHVV